MLTSNDEEKKGHKLIFPPLISPWWPYEGGNVKFLIKFPNHIVSGMYGLKKSFAKSEV